MKFRLLFLLLLPLQVLAEQEDVAIPEIVDPVSTGYLLKLTFGLVLVVGIIFGLAWLMKKMQWTQHSQKGLIQIISAVSVSHRDRIALIQVGDEQILVGMSPGRMQTLHTLKSPLEVSPSSKGAEEQKGFANHFQQNLKQVIKREDS